MNQEFLTELLQAAGPSGYERRAADVFAKEAETFARVHEDHFGNVYAEVGPEDAPVLALLGHLDEIGLIVSHVGKEGFIHVQPIGGWDPQVLVGQRIRLLAPGGDVIGVIGKKAIHVMEPEERKKASTLEELWIDIGLPADEVKALIPVGTPAVIDQGPVQVGNCLVSRAIDDRIGAFVVLEALRRLKAEDLRCRVVAVGTAQEEIGVFGAKLSSYALSPVAGIAVDVTHETGQPGVKKERFGELPFGSGANLETGPLLSPGVLAGLKAAGDKEGIPYTVSARGRFTGTDADAMALSKAGVPSAVVSVPNRYMHSPNEMVDLRDVQACIDIIAAFAQGFDPEADLRRR